MKLLTLTLLMFSIAVANAAPTKKSAQTRSSSVSQDMDSLGANQELLLKAKAMDPGNRVRVVQNRQVDRNWRLELGLNYGMVAGGDSYLNTNNLGGQIEMHVNPRWSVGARYYNSSNSLTNEGQRAHNLAAARASEGEQWQIPDVSYAKNTYFGTISFYPIYGKMNLFDWTISQFDMYLIAGYGQVQLANRSQSSTAPTWTAGTGFGVWLTSWLSSRLEVRYQNYEDKISNGPRNLDLMVVSGSIGFLL